MIRWEPGGAGLTRQAVWRAFLSFWLPAAMAVAAGLAFSADAAAQSAPGVSAWKIRPPVGESVETPAEGRTDRAPENPAVPRRREFVIAPLPMINPTLDNGGALILGVLYPLSATDRVAPPSATFLTGFLTSNDSWAAGFGQLFHFSDDRLRVKAAGAYMSINVDYFGIGADAGDASRAIPINQTGGGGMAEMLVLLGDRWYAGARYRLSRKTITPNVDGLDITVPVQDIRLRSAMLGPHVERDSRDNQFYPRNGALLDAMALFAGEAIGGRRTYQMYQASLGVYRSLGTRQVVASRVNACRVSDAAPFYDLCLIGQHQDLRGYQTGQYRDHAMLTGQVEYRLEAWKRIGVVAFAGLGQVAGGFDRFTTDNVLPSGGAGVRIRLTRQNHMNLRIDYAWGTRSNALYMSVGEAF